LTLLREVPAVYLQSTIKFLEQFGFNCRLPMHYSHYPHPPSFDWTLFYMPVLLILFLPSIVCYLLLIQRGWSWYFHHKSHRTYRFKKQYYLHQQIECQWYWNKLHIMAFYQKHVAPALVKYQLWIFKRHNWKYKFLCLKRTTGTPRRPFSDDTRDLYCATN
jgi:hypothetical protein